MVVVEQTLPQGGNHKPHMHVSPSFQPAEEVEEEEEVAEEVDKVGHYYTILLFIQCASSTSYIYLSLLHQKDRLRLQIIQPNCL